MTSPTTCAICARSDSSPSAQDSEKPLQPGRTLPCCSRAVCARCLAQNPRYSAYCPYCQISSTPSRLPQGLRDPPAYSSLDSRLQRAPPDTSLQLAPEDEPDELPPAYTARNSSSVSPSSAAVDSKSQPPAEDVLHFLSPTDTLLSLSLAYGVPLAALRKTNNIFSDHLLQARKTVLIPGEFYKGGVSLSPTPILSEEEELKQTKVRRWMVATKVPDYEVAGLYLEQARWDLQLAVHVYQDDERWEKEHPVKAKEKGKGRQGVKAKDVGMRRFVGETTRVR